jgi:plasmid stabilization system protein ParE
MKKYLVEISETAERDLENIISYLRHNLAGDIIADKYKILFKQELTILLFMYKIITNYKTKEKNKMAKILDTVHTHTHHVI